MVDVAPFRAWHYDLSQVGELADVTAPPYDVIDPARRQALETRHPRNIVALTLPVPNPDVPGQNRYQRAADLWRDWRSEGLVFQDRTEALYVYHQQFDLDGKTYLRRGVLGLLRIESPESGLILPHEQTLPAPKQDRLELIRATRSNFEPIFGLYSDETLDIQQRLDDACTLLTPAETRDEAGVLHRVWTVTEPAVINTARQALADKTVYIADGHHRYETSRAYRDECRSRPDWRGELDPSNRLLAMLVPMDDPGLVILPTHRLVTNIAPIDGDQLRSALGEHFELDFVGKGDEGGRDAADLIERGDHQNHLVFGLSADQSWWLAEFREPALMASRRPQKSEEWRSLAVAVLHEIVLGVDLAAAQPERAPEIRYVHETSVALSSVASGACTLACLVPPVQIEHLQLIAGGRETMPPKSTFFYPKLLSGLLWRSFSH